MTSGAIQNTEPFILVAWPNESYASAAGESALICAGENEHTSLLRDTEIGDLTYSSGIDKDIIALEVAMPDVFRMKVREAF